MTDKQAEGDGKLQAVLEIGRALASAIDLDELLELVVAHTTKLLSADRSTLYLFSADKKELWSKVLQGGEMREIRLRVGEGIAGWVAQTGSSINASDAYADERFQPSVDTESGYKTESVLCLALTDSIGEPVGVIQVLNKRGGAFNESDEELLRAVGAQAAISIENALLYRSVLDKNVELMNAREELAEKSAELNLLFEIEQTISTASGRTDLLDRLLGAAMNTAATEAGAILLCEEEHFRFETVRGQSAAALAHTRVERSDHPVDKVIESGRAAVLSGADLGLDSDAVLAAPLVDGGQRLGAIALWDKTPWDRAPAGSEFDESDHQLLTLVAGQAARAIVLVEKKQAADRQERLAALGHTLAGVLHDLRTPMTIISGYAQLMAGNDDSKKREAFAELISQQFDVMNGMTRELLQFARGDSSLLLSRVLLNDFLNEVGTQLRHALTGKNIELIIEAEFAGAVHFDRLKMMRVLHNLTSNASDAMPAGGTITIRTRLAGGRLILEFSDDGPGISPALEGRLFEPFASDKESGTGLGLALVRSIVEQHKGAIDYSSSPEHGTRFEIQLPLDPRSD